MDENTYKIASFIPLEWDGTKLVKVLLASMDVSQEKKAEIESHKALKDAYRAAENASRAKTDFLSNMSHDIRTPMNAIVGLTAIAGANIENQDRVVECLGKITKASRHLLGLINEVLDMARIESGRMSLAEEDFSLPELVDNLLTLTKPAIDEHHHQLEVHVEHIEHEAVCGDSLRIQQVFVNLMSNAVKYTPDGGNITFYDQGKTERLLGAWLLRVFHRGQRHRYDAGIPEDHVRAVQPGRRSPDDQGAGHRSWHGHCKKHRQPDEW